MGANMEPADLALDHRDGVWHHALFRELDIKIEQIDSGQGHESLVDKI